MVADKGGATVSKLLTLQALVMVTVVLSVMLLAGASKAVSSAFGGLIALIPNIYFASRLHLATGKDAKDIVRTFYASETTKILLTAALFVLAFQIHKVDMVILLISYVAVVSMHWLALILWRD